MKNGFYLIGEVSRITGISKDTLHFYSKTGLLVPEYTDPENGYGYYSHRNLWQLDIISACRKLSVPLETVRRILSLKDNEEIVRLLMSYREKALALSDYYRQVADDIVWYREENERIIAARKNGTEVSERYLQRQVVIAGADEENGLSYHANLQNAVKNETCGAASIRRKYGYVLDAEALSRGIVIKKREYLKPETAELWSIPEENLLELPAGSYAVCTLEVRNETVDFSPVLSWLQGSGRSAGAAYAEEVGLQLFPYMDSYYCQFKIELK